MARAAALLLWLLLVGSLNLTASLLEFEPRRAKDSDVIGIDLGITYSRVAVYRKGRAEIVPDEHGNRAIPSQVTFTVDGRRLVGEDAENQHAANTIYGAAKRLLGRRFSDAAVQREIELLRYDVVDNDGKPYVRVQVGDGVLVLSPEEIVAEVLANLKGTAEAFLGREVTKAIITVPAYYSDAQRQATKDAGFLAGLQVLRVMNEPTFAAIAYGLDKRYDKKTLVFDLGGSTFDVTVLIFEDSFFDVLSISGDSHLGGEDFDQRVTDHFVELIKQKHGRDITDDGRALRRLRGECERAKRALSDQQEARVEIEAMFDDGVNFSEPLTRAQFEELNEDLFLKTMAQLETAMADAELDKREIDHIILVGGSAKIPKVKQLVKDYFDGKEPLSGINPEEAMAYGAAVMGSYLATRGDEDLPMLHYGPVEPAIGIEADDGTMTPVIPRNPTLPTKKTHVLTTFWDKRSTVTIKVFQGERRETKDCRFLGQLDLSGIPTPSIWNWGRRDIEVTMEVDEYGELHVEAADRRSGKSESAIYNKNRHQRLSPEEIDRMVREADAWAARDKLVAYMHNFDGDLEQEVEEAVSEAWAWLDLNPDAEKEDYEEKLRELTDVCDPIVLAVHKSFPYGHDNDEL